MHLEELSLVDIPANAQAMVSLFKRDNSVEENTKMKYKETDTKKMEYDLAYAQQMADAANAQVAEMMAVEQDKAAEVAEDKLRLDEMELARLETDRLNTEAREADRKASETLMLEGTTGMDEAMKRENEFLRKGLIDNGYVITKDEIKKKSEVETIEVGGEMVAKSDIPAVVLKALEDAKFEKADAELTKSATEILPHFDLDVAKSLINKFSDEENIIEALKAADAAFGSTMEEFGKSDSGEEFSSASDKLDSIVKSYMEENKLKKSDFAKAYAIVAKTDEGKDLINKTYKGV